MAKTRWHSGAAESALSEIGSHSLAWTLALLSVLVYWLSMVLFFEVLTRRALAPVSVSLYLMTIFGVLISTTILHEALTSSMLIGALLVFFGTIFANAQKARPTG
jgi:drug/metabolite transporter (DMT)-like permease